MVRLRFPKIRIDKKRTATTVLALLFLVLTALQPATVGAYSDVPGHPSSAADIHGYITGSSWYDPNAGVCAIVNGQSVSPAVYQEANAKAVIGIAKTLNLGQQGALIGLMTGLTESNLKNYANNGTYKDSDEDYSGTRLGEISQGLPHDAVGNDHDSVGIMQQRVTGGWAQMGGSYGNLNNPEVIKRLMTPAFAAEAFYKVLMGVSGWQTMDPGVAAQTVQVSAFPNAYNDHKTQAQSLLDQYWASAQPVPLPFPLEGGEAPAVGAGTGCVNGGSGSIIAKIRDFAWPDYRAAGTSKAMEKKPLYQEAVNRSSYRGSCDGVDCGAFVTMVMRESGADPKYNTGPEGNTVQQIDYLQRNSGPGGKYTRVTSKDALQPGDIAIKSRYVVYAGIPRYEGHTFFFVGDAISKIDPSWTGGQSASASQCERAPMASGTDSFEDYQWYHLNVAPTPDATNTSAPQP